MPSNPNQSDITAYDLARLLAAVHGKEPKASGGNWWVTFCPAHNDTQNPSFSLRDGPEGIDVHCFTGCQPKDILDAIEKETGHDIRRYASRPNYIQPVPRPREQKQEPEPKDKGEVVQEWAYYDGEGTEAYIIQRRDHENGKKSFRPRHTNWEGNEIWNLQGVERYLYNLPAVLDAKENGNTIYIVEGEKCADSLIAEGLCATTSCGGAQGWSSFESSYVASLKGAANIVIIPDCDDPGYGYARDIAISLYKAGQACRILSLPDIEKGEDVYDWFEKGHSKHELENYQFMPKLFEIPHSAPIKNSLYQPVRRIRAVNAADIEITEHQWLWQNHIPIGEVTMVAGQGGVGKSTVVYAIASTVSKGGMLPDDTGELSEQVTAGNVIIFSGEDDPSATILPQLHAGQANLNRINFMVGTELPINVPKELESSFLDEFVIGKTSELAQAMREFEPTLVIFDPIQAFMPPGTDMNKGDHVRPILRGLADLALEYSCAVICIAHPPKANQSASAYQIAGSHEFSSAVRSVFIVAPDPEDEDVAILAHSKNNWGARSNSLRFAKGGECLEWVGISPLSADDLMGPERGFIGNVANLCQVELYNYFKKEGKNKLERGFIVDHLKLLDFNEKMIMKVKARMGIQSIMLGSAGAYWKLPKRFEVEH